MKGGRNALGKRQTGLTKKRSEAHRRSAPLWLPIGKTLRAALYPKIDPKIGQDAWRGTLNRQINQSINAGRMVPLPPRHYGIPR